MATEFLFARLDFAVAGQFAATAVDAGVGALLLCCQFYS